MISFSTAASLESKIILVFSYFFLHGSFLKSDAVTWKFVRSLQIRDDDRSVKCKEIQDGKRSI